MLIVLFLLTAGFLVWTFLPTNPEKLYDRAEKLMESDDSEDWETALEKYLKPLRERHPDFKKEEVKALRQEGGGRPRQPTRGAERPAVGGVERTPLVLREGAAVAPAGQGRRGAGGLEGVDPGLRRRAG